MDENIYLTDMNKDALRCVSDLHLEGQVLVPAWRLAEHPADGDVRVRPTACHLYDDVRALVQTLRHSDVLIGLKSREGTIVDHES